MNGPILRMAALCAAAGALATAGAWWLRIEAGAQEPAPAGDLISDADWPATPSEARGRVVYERHCVGCHGKEGRGDGAAARFLDPLPRDFHSGKFKFRSTPYGEMPLPEDVLRTVTCGLPGSSMPGFPLVSEVDRRDVVACVLRFARLGRANQLAAAAVTEGDLAPGDVVREIPAIAARVEAMSAIRRIPVPAEPPATPESVARGGEQFQKLCAACHGARGVGDGNSSYTLRDWQDAPIRPRDFTAGVFRSGSTPEDVYTRIRTGLSGTPMPAYTAQTDTEVWELTQFILSLKDPAAAKPRMPAGCGHGDGR